MGVASCGKTSVGEALAQQLGAQFTEGDRLHPAANIAKMSSGTPLTDEDRWPWLAEIGKALAGPGGKIASCSALKKVYRQRIAEAAGRPVAFVFLDGSRALLEARIAARKGHFMPPSLLDSQLKTLEAPGPDELALRLDVDEPVSELVVKAADWLRGTAFGGLTK
ncbi:MAG: gluconokinase [Alphaproteobacteria bacterium]|nr:gluconokinase [Alphaproteobacteria bacterium]